MDVLPAKILLATDGSEDAALALRAAVDLANATGSELHVVTVGPDWPAHLAFEHAGYLDEYLRELRREAQEMLDDQVKKIQESGGTVARTHLRIGGRPDREIVELAEELGVGLIIVGSRGLGGIKRALMGSVSDSVVRHAHCPVLVVRGQEDGRMDFPPRKVLLATDGSEEAELAAQTAATLADNFGSELHIVTVGRGHPEQPSSKAADEWPRYKAEDVLDRQVTRLRKAGREVARAHVRMAEKPDAAIVGLAEELGAGLIVVGSRGLGGVRRALMGSVSDSVVRHAHCPALVVRPTRDAGERSSPTRRSFADRL